jgi:hypothetical protein
MRAEWLPRKQRRTSATGRRTRMRRVSDGQRPVGRLLTEARTTDGSLRSVDSMRVHQTIPEREETAVVHLGVLVVIVVLQCSREQPGQVVLTTYVGQVVAAVRVDRLIDAHEHPDTNGEQMFVVEQHWRDPHGHLILKESFPRIGEHEHDACRLSEDVMLLVHVLVEPTGVEQVVRPVEEKVFDEHEDEQLPGDGPHRWHRTTDTHVTERVEHGIE